MRPVKCCVLCLAGVACTPATDLQKEQTAVPTSEDASGSLSSPASDSLSGVLVEPPSGSLDLPTNLTTIVVRFTEQVQAAGADLPFVLRSATGNGLPVPLGAAVSCSGSCYQLLPGLALAPSTLYTLEVLPSTLQFLDGKPTPGGSAG